MRLDRRLVLIGVILIVLSMTMATQYASTRISYSFAIAHPSAADIRFMSSDNSSDDGVRVLRVTNNESGAQTLTIELGDHSPNSWKNYTAVFGIVNEENFTVDITHMNLTGTNTTFLTVWLHGDRDADYGGEGAASVKMINDGTAVYTSADAAWSLAAGDGNVNTFCADADTQIETSWDTDSYTQFSLNDANNSVNGTSDFAWVGMSINVPSDAGPTGSVTGTLFINFKSTTDT